ELVSSEIDLPFIRRRFLGDTAGLFYGGVCALFFVRPLFNESVWIAFRRGSNPRFFGVALLVLTDPPCVWCEDLLLNDAAKFGLSATFKLDEVLDFLVGREFCRLVESLRRPAILLRQRTRHTQSIRPIHLQVDRHQWKSYGEVLECEDCCRYGQCGENDPKKGTTKHGGF